MVCLFLAFWPEFIYRSVRLMDYSLEMSILGLALWIWVPSLKRFTVRREAIVGALLGTLIFLRPQTGLELIGFACVAWALGGKQRVKRITALGIGYGATVFGLGVIEWIVFPTSTTGFLLAPLYNNIHYNMIEGGAARDYGAQPWHRYVTEFLKFYGFAPIALLVPALVWGRVSWALWVWAALPMLAHSFIQHKEGRFLFGSFWIFVLVVAVALKDPRIKGALKSKRVRAAVALVIAIGFIINFQRAYARSRLFADDMRAFTLAGQKMQEEGMHNTGALFWPVRIEADPVFNPGNFFLRRKSPVCFQAKCTPAQRDARPQWWLNREPDGRFELRELIQ
jgi:hypothetical protein